MRKALAAGVVAVLFMKIHTPSTIGVGGRLAYFESISDQNAYAVAITRGATVPPPA